MSRSARTIRNRGPRRGREADPFLSGELPITDVVGVEDVSDCWFTKEDCPGCVAKTDGLGRLPIGDCGPDCLMRRERERHRGLR